MNFNKGFSLFMLITLLAGTDLSLVANVAANVKKDLNKKVKIEEILGTAGAIALAAAVYKGWRWKQKFGSVDSFEEFMNRGYNRAAKAIADRESSEKMSLGKRYNGLSDAVKAEIVENNFQTLVLDDAGRLLGIDGNTLKAYVMTVPVNKPTPTFQDRLDAVEVLVNHLTADKSVVWQGEPNGVNPFKAALRYAVKNSITTPEQATAAVNTMPKNAAINPETGRPIGDTPATRAGRVVAGTLDDVANAAGNLAGAGAEGLERVAQRAAAAAAQAAAGYSAEQQEAAGAQVRNVEQYRARVVPEGDVPTAPDYDYKPTAPADLPSDYYGPY